MDDNKENENVDNLPEVTKLVSMGLNLLKHKNSSIKKLSGISIVKNSNKSLVIRCKSESVNTPPEMLLIKKNKIESSYNFNEWAGLYFINHLQINEIFIPKFYGGDIINNFYIMQDLGRIDNLESILFKNDKRVFPVQLMKKIISSAASFHFRTMKKEKLFIDICNSLPCPKVPLRYHEINVLQERLHIFLKFQKELNCILPAGFDECCRRVAEYYANPGSFLAYTHFDLVPLNILIDKNIFFIDFEFGAFRHILNDIICWNFLFPLPDNLVNELNNHYFFELTKMKQIEHEHFNIELAYISAFRGLNLLTEFLPFFINRDLPMRNWTGRKMILITLKRMNELINPCVELEPIRIFADSLIKELGKRWQINLDLFPDWTLG